MMGASACAPGDDRGAGRPATGSAPGEIPCPAPCELEVMSATTLAAPLRAALGSFAAASGARVRHESGGSLELARRITELARTPDILALADREVFDALIVPAHASWYAGFARNRMVLAYTDRSRGADRLTPDSWRSVILAPGVEVARSDPAHDPMGYRALLLFALAERHFGERGLAARLERSASARHMRARSSELVALLQAGEADYAWTYESVARAAGLRWLPLPREIDLGSPGDSARYAAVSVRVPGSSPRDSVTIHGRPILYALTIPRAAAHRAVAERFAAWLLSPAGRNVLRAHGLDALEAPFVVGDSAPPFDVASDGAVSSLRPARTILIPGGGPRPIAEHRARARQP